MVLFGLDLNHPQWIMLRLILGMVACVGVVAATSALLMGLWYAIPRVLTWIGVALVIIFSYLGVFLFKVAVLVGVIIKVLILEPSVLSLKWVTKTFRISWGYVGWGVMFLACFIAPYAWLYFVLKPEYFQDTIKGNSIVGAVLGLIAAPFVLWKSWGKGFLVTTGNTLISIPIGVWGSTAFVAFYALMALMGD